MIMMMMVWRGPGGAWSGGPGGVVRCVVNGLLSTHKSQLCFDFTILVLFQLYTLNKVG